MEMRVRGFSVASGANDTLMLSFGEGFFCMKEGRMGVVAVGATALPWRAKPLPWPTSPTPTGAARLYSIAGSVI